MTTSTRTLNILAALTWYIGGAVLLLKGISLLFEANALNPDQLWIWIAVVAGLLFGTLKVKYIFRKACQKNLTRIAALEDPMLWQFFRPGFFLALALMIATGATLSRMAHDNYFFLIAVATLDLSLATALLGSSFVFWEQKALAK